MRKKFIYTGLLLILFFIGGITRVFAQDNTIFDDDRVLYNREAKGGFLLHNYGWALNFMKYYKRTVNKQRYFEIQLSFAHHPKRRKSYNVFINNAKGFYYGQLNTFFVLRWLYGNKKIIAHKIRSSGVELSYEWGIGPSFGFLKPVYLEIVDFEYNVLRIEKYDPEKHDLYNIYGRAGGLRGLDEIKFRPGLYLKFGIQIEFSPKKAGIFGLEAGVALDAYLQKIEMMAYIDNIQFFPVLYLNIFLGKKYNKM